MGDPSGAKGFSWGCYHLTSYEAVYFLGELSIISELVFPDYKTSVAKILVGRYSTSFRFTEGCRSFPMPIDSEEFYSARARSAMIGFPHRELLMAVSADSWRSFAKY